MKSANRSHRVLVIDDNESIHEDLRKVLAKSDDREFDGLVTMLAPASEPGDADAKASTSSSVEPTYEIVSAYQGKEGLEQVRASVAENKRFSVAYVDMRMPPGWDGLETIERIWEVDPTLQIVICSAYSDNSWDTITSQLGDPDGLLILKKPFDVTAAQQCALVLARKRALEDDSRA